MRTKQVLVFFVTILITVMAANAGSIKIENASEAQRNIIQAALGDQYPISKIAVVKSGNHSKAYYVGAVFHAEGVGNVTGIWLVGGEKNAPSLVFSVDGAAHQFSGMRKASETKASASIADPEAMALKNYFSK
jgi:hypothetical protein